MNTRLRSSLALIAAITLAGTLTACAGDTAPVEPPSTPAPTASETSSAAPSPTPEPTTEPAEALDKATLDGILTRIQFNPSAYETTAAMFAGVYPDVTAAADCLAVLGVGTVDNAATTSFGPSTDRTLTVLISSFGSGASAYFDGLSRSAQACAAAPQIVFQGTPLDVDVTFTEISATAFEVALSGTVGSNPISVIGQVEIAGEDVVALAGWDPATNRANVPLALGMFVDAVVAARGAQ